MERLLVRALESGITAFLSFTAGVLAFLHYVTAIMFYVTAVVGAYLSLKSIAGAIDLFLQAPIGTKSHSSDWTWVICVAATGLMWLFYRGVKGVRGEWGSLQTNIMALPAAFAPPAVIGDQRD